MKVIKKIAERMAKTSIKTAMKVSDNTSLFCYHQPKEPKTLKAKK